MSANDSQLISILLTFGLDCIHRQVNRRHIGQTRQHSRYESIHHFDACIDETWFGWSRLQRSKFQNMYNHVILPTELPQWLNPHWRCCLECDTLPNLGKCSNRQQDRSTCIWAFHTEYRRLTALMIVIKSSIWRKKFQTSDGQPNDEILSPLCPYPKYTLCCDI